MNGQKRLCRRNLLSEFDVIGPYFTIDSTMEAKFLYGIVVRTMLLHSVQTLVSDGESANLSLMKVMLMEVQVLFLLGLPPGVMVVRYTLLCSCHIK